MTTTNCSNNYGPYQFPEKLIPLVIVNILEGRPLPIYGDGRNIRDWLFVADHCRAIELVLDEGAPGETYNVGGRAELENIELVGMICDLADAQIAAHPDLKYRFPKSLPASGKTSRSLMTFVADRPGHDRRYAINCTKIERQLGFRPLVAPANGLEATIHWFVENTTWSRSVHGRTYRQWLARQYGATTPS